MKVFIMGLLVALSQLSHGLEVQNARELFKQEEERMKKSIPVRALLPVPGISALFHIPFFKRHRACKTMRGYFDSSYIRTHKRSYKRSEVKEAKKIITKLLKNVKTSLEKQVKSNPEAMLEGTQATLTKKIRSMDRKEFVQLLRKTDKTVPPILGLAKTGFARCDIPNFIYSIYTLDHAKSNEPKSILEAGIEAAAKLRS